ncbi:MAG: hypothetical protein KY466_07085 [Gemmatimonadetes bacterium]|nr:hypothetical protein [Gemmatimonadota bacterium]
MTNNKGTKRAMTNLRPRTGRLRMFAVLASVGLLGACDAVDKLLEVTNPARIPEESLDQRKLIPILMNSVVGEFQDAYADPFIWRGSMFTDEQVTGINWEATARLNQRITRYDEGDPDFMFSSLSSARAMADSVAGRLRTMLDEPSSDERLAKALNYAGYSYILLGDAMCEATINMGSEIHQPLDLYAFAVDRFEEALDIARAAGSSDMENLALVGLSRAHLNLGNWAQVQTYAPQVDDGFVWWVEYAEDTRADNTMFSRITGANHSLGVHPRFLNGTYGADVPESQQTDPRIQHFVEGRRGHNQLSILYTPFQSLAYSGYTGETQADGEEPPLYERGTDIKMASKLEAMHHYWEAVGQESGVTAGLLDFINERRAVGNQGIFLGTGEAALSQLREQRARDLFLGGFRLGDLRRWDRQGISDPDHEFPSGEHPTTEWGLYGDATCFPLPIEEYQGNPNISDPNIS